MKLYIAGRITGDDTAAEKFERAELELIAQSHVPVNPFKVAPTIPDWEWADYLKADIKHMLDCDGVYALNDWRQSRGATIEVQLAQQLGMEVIYQ